MKTMKRVAGVGMEEVTMALLTGGGGKIFISPLFSEQKWYIENGIFVS